MAGYFITKNKNVVDKTISFIKKSFPKYHILKDIGKEKWNIIYFQKMNIINANNHFFINDDFIIGTGTYYYKEKFAEEALPLIIKDFINEEIDFSLVIGHFNFILFVKGLLYIITDKTGYYFSFKTEIQGSIVYSTSMLTLANSKEDLVMSKQEALEFCNVAATFGGKTIFDNIQHLEYGSIISPETNKIKKYFNPYIKQIKYYDFIRTLKDYFSVISKTPRNIGVDISGGLDTRTVLSAMMQANAKYILLTNNRSEKITKDKEISKIIAKKINKKIEEIDLNSNYLNKTFDNNDVVIALEAVRGLDILKHVINEIYNKSNKCDVLIGGWGAEMLRNQHGRFSSIKEAIKGYGYYRIILDNTQETDYLNSLMKKAEKDILPIQKERGIKESELLYYFEKGRFWAGSVLSARNKFSYCLFPFYDPIIAIPLLGLSRKSNHLQKKVIKTLDKELLSIPFGNMDTDSILISLLKRFLKQNFFKTHFYKKKENSLDFPREDSNEDIEHICTFLQFNKGTFKKEASRSIAKCETLEILYQILLKSNE